MPNLLKLKLGFDAHGVDQHGTIAVGIMHLIGLKEISVKIGGAGAIDPYRSAAESALIDAIKMHPAHPTYNIQCLDGMFSGKDDNDSGVKEEEHMTLQKQYDIKEEDSIEQHGILQKGTREDAHSRFSAFSDWKTVADKQADSRAHPPRRIGERTELSSSKKQTRGLKTEALECKIMEEDSNKGKGGAEHPNDITMDPPQRPRGPMTRSRARAIETEEDSNKGKGDAEHPNDFTMDPPQMPIGPMTRSRARAIETKVTSLLFELPMHLDETEALKCKIREEDSNKQHGVLQKDYRDDANKHALGRVHPPHRIGERTELSSSKKQTRAHDLFEDSMVATELPGIETGTKLYISNLHYGVTKEDLQELFYEMGHVKSCALHYDINRRPTGSAEVIFARRSEAVEALKRYNNVRLDGKEMRIEVIGANLGLAAAPAPLSVSVVPGAREKLSRPSGFGRGATGSSNYLSRATIDAQAPTTMSFSAAAVGVISGFNECVTLWQWAKSAISSLHSRWSGSQQQDLQDCVLQLESGLQLLRDTLPAMYDLINKAEWRSHEHGVAKLLPNLKDAVAEAEDLLDEFRWYEMKVQVEGNASQSLFTQFFDTVVQGSFNQLKGVQLRLNHLSSQLENMRLHGVTQRFDKLVRPETTSLPNETKIFGRDKELEKILGFLNVPTNLKRKRSTSSINASTSTSTSNQVNDESRIPSLLVLPIVGIGGVGKTTLAQHICRHRRVKSHFELIIWICVSDDFDVNRLTKEAIHSCTRKEATTNNLDSLQRTLSGHVNNKRLLIVLDDMWDDALKENGQRWKRFCAPFRSVQEGSAMLVTTRCPNVSKGVRTMEPIIVEGLNDDVFWNFFKLCAFGSEGSNNDPELECIGRSILPKLKGSPLAAKTLGRMLSMDLRASHWNFILESELWELKQEETDILPALRLSYMYLPFYLKQCFAFCAVYPKDYKFEKEHLAEIWVAEGFVEPQSGVPIQYIGCQYFEDLVARSFFQKVSGGYVIHDLMHDMAQKVSEHDCFILRNKSDFDKVPESVHHLYIHPSNDFDDSDLLRLCKFTKLRTLICEKTLGKESVFAMDQWGTKLLRMRVFSCAFINELPDGIGNWKHLRYLEISKACPLKKIPSTFCWLYNLQIIYAKKCKLEGLPHDFGKLISLQKFETHRLTLDSDNQEGSGIRSLKYLSQFRGHLDITNVGISKDHAAEVELKNMKYLEELKLNMHSPTIQNREVLEVLQPPISLKSLFLQNYGGSSLPSWFQQQNLPSLESLTFESCDGLKSINLNVIPEFWSLTDATIKGYENISSQRLVSQSLRSSVCGILVSFAISTAAPSLNLLCHASLSHPSNCKRGVFQLYRAWKLAVDLLHLLETPLIVLFLQELAALEHSRPLKS